LLRFPVGELWRLAVMCPQWRQVDAALFAAVVGGRDGARYHLIVERLPSGNDWD